MRGVQKRCQASATGLVRGPQPFVKHVRHVKTPLRSQSRGAKGRSAVLVAKNSANDQDSAQVQLLQATIDGYGSTDKARKLLVYFPGTDGTGNAISPQLSGLLGAGFDVRALYISVSNRSDWDELTEQTVGLIHSLVRDHPTENKVTLVAESFGGCLGLRCLSAAPELFERSVLVNPATCFAKSYGGLPNLLASTNLLSIFPEQLYQIAQAILIPFLVEQENMGMVGLEAVRQMISMSPPENRRVAELATDHGTSSRSRSSIFRQLESYGPAAAGSWRIALLCSGNLPDHQLATIRTPTLLISSAKDRLLGSLQEGARLERVMGNAMRLVLPRSGHTALLEDDVKLINILRWSNFLPPDLAPSAIKRGHAGSEHRRAEQQQAAHVPSNGVAWQNSHKGIMASQGLGSLALSQGRRSNGQVPRSPSSITAIGNAQSSAAIASPESLRDGQSSLIGQADATTSSRAGPQTPRNGQGGMTDLSQLPASASSQRGSQPDAPPIARPGQGQGQGRQGSQSLQQQKNTPWSNPSPAFDQAISLMTPLRELISPMVRGVENIPSASETDRPLLFVGNHARIGLYDMPYLMTELYLRGVKVRGLAHPAHWSTPLGTFFEAFGAVKASPMSAYKLLKNGEAVLLFPGGGREVNKRKGEEYRLFWSEEPDFVRMAAKLNALIVPFASVGADEAFDIALDSDEILQTPILGDLMKRVVQRVDPSLDLAESVPPLTKLPGLGIPSLVPIPNLSRLYFRFMPPIDPTARSGGRMSKDGPEAQQVYSDVKQEVYRGIRLLQDEQQTDPKRSLSTRFYDQLSRVFPAFKFIQ